VLPRFSRAAALLAASIIVPFALPGAARAGTYSFTQDTQANVDGWAFAGDPGYYGCSILRHGGPCSDGDVPVPTPLRVFAFGSVAAGSSGGWEFVAPPTTTFVSGTLSLSYSTLAGTALVYAKARLRSQQVASQPRMHTSYSDSTGTIWSVPAGEEAVGVYVGSDAADARNDKWRNTIAVTQLQATLRDDTPPVVRLSGPLASDTWHAQRQPVCVAVDATDAGAGIASAALVDETGTQLDRSDVTLHARPQPGLPQLQADLCVNPSQLSDGSHALRVEVRDAAGEVATSPLPVRVDTHSPEAVGIAPDGSTEERRPQVAFRVDAGPSGLAELSATLDGAPMQVSGDSAQIVPAADLAFGEHMVVWHAADVAGNVRDGFWSFRIVDRRPPELSAFAPADGWQGEWRRPRIGLTLADAGTGVDPTSLRVLLDGIDVAGAGTLADGAFDYQPPADLGYGLHRLRVLVADRAGNAAAPAEWTFTVVDRTPPVLSDPRPDDGASGPDRTPPVSVAVRDDGIGLAADAVGLTLDGRPVAAARLGDDRFGFTPSEPLSFGLHVVTAHASDLSGNAAAPLEWTFVVRDETAPTIGEREPADGVTVDGAVTIGFTIADAGMGVDASTLHVLVDGSDVTGWGSLAGGRFRYAPGNLGAGVHTIAVSVEDRDGNAAHALWQFAVADPVTLSLRFPAPAGALVSGHATTLHAQVLANGRPLAGAEVRLSAQAAGAAVYGPERALVAGADGAVAWMVAPRVTTHYRVRLAAQPSVEESATVTVRYAVVLRAAHTRLRAGSPLGLSGRVSPSSARAIAIQMLTRAGWRTVAQPRLRAGSFSATVLPRLQGRYLFRAVAAAGSANARGLSSIVAVRVR
jgi:hypothetical protein